MNNRKRWIAAACIGALASTGALAQSYPQKPIKAIVPYGVGQATDVMCRVFLDRVRVELNQPIVVENKPGAGGNIGGAEAARSPADGYTVLCTGNATHISNPFLYANQGFDPEKELAPVTAIAGVGYVLMVGSKHKGKSLAEILALARTSPKPLTVGVASATAQVLYGMLGDAAKVKLERVPYATGNAALFTDLMRGDTDLVIEAMASAMTPINNGQLTPVAVTNPKRSPLLPDVPTFKESGIDVQLIGWNAFYVPKATPAEIVATLNKAANVALKDPEVAKRFATVASEPIGGSPEQLEAMIKADRALFEPRIKALGLKAQ